MQENLAPVSINSVEIEPAFLGSATESNAFRFKLRHSVAPFKAQGAFKRAPFYGSAKEKIISFFKFFKSAHMDCRQ